jgi:two-component system, LuxR family, response regulator FixJ
MSTMAAERFSKEVFDPSMRSHPRNNSMNMAVEFLTNQAKPDTRQVPTNPVVLIVDDDERMRSALRRLFFLEGLAVEIFESGRDLLEHARLDRPGCLILDLKMPDMNGLEVQAKLNERQIGIPLIFLTGASDVPVAVAAMHAGAVDFLEKPFENALLVLRVRQAISHHQEKRSQMEEQKLLAVRMQKLTPREREILKLVVAGQTSKEIARNLGSSHRTVEIHRNHLMEKTGAKTLAELIRIGILCGQSN